MKSGLLRLKKLNNARDLGGMEAFDGKKIKYRRLIRSGELYCLPEETVTSLKNMGLTTIIDLRLPAGCSDCPDTPIEGSEYIRVPLPTTPMPCEPCEKTMRLTLEKESHRIKKEFGTMDKYMTETYRSILFDENSREGLKKFLRIIIDGEGCILWHCASGKDRAAICAMLLEGLLGVSEGAILEDYMLSKRYWRARYVLNRLVLCVVPIRHRFRKLLFGIMRTKRKYLLTVIRELEEKYGGIIQYCKSELGITDEDIEILRTKYLE